MSNRDLQNEMLDQIGRRLLKAARTSDEEIEKIVAAPQLFDSVKARIKAQEQTRRKTKSFFSGWMSIFNWNFQNTAGAFAVLIVLAAGAAVIIFKNQDSPQSVKQSIQTEIRPQIAQADDKAPVLEIEETKILQVKNRSNAERAVFKATPAKSPAQVRKSNPAKPRKNTNQQTQEIFYSLAVAGNWEADGEDLRVVRTELSKSELFTLGVTLPVENEARKVKTDLLVSADGVARAIRFVE